MKSILYVHGGSGNHGCEALVRTLVPLFSKSVVGNPIVLAANIKQDNLYELEKCTNLLSPSDITNKLSIDFIKAYIQNRLFGNYIYMDMLPWKKLFSNFSNKDVAFAIGGDTYSYSFTENNSFMHEMFCKLGMRTALWGCSITPELMDDPRVLADLNKFNVISARESITYNALIAHGIKNVVHIPDSAFLLPCVQCNDSKLIQPNKTIGLNLSPMVMDYALNKNFVLKNFETLIEYIFKSTDYDIALIPHVVWKTNDDRKILRVLYEKYRSSNRIVMISDHNCMELKDIISRCRFFIGARTHATIAAYSMGVPTLVLGYSVKARGIATDLFGTENNYVIPVQSLGSPQDLKYAFQWLEKNELQIRQFYLEILPSYIDRVYKTKNVLNSYFSDL